MDTSAASIPTLMMSMDIDKQKCCAVYMRSIKNKVISKVLKNILINGFYYYFKLRWMIYFAHNNCWKSNGETAYKCCFRVNTISDHNSDQHNIRFLNFAFYLSNCSPILTDYRVASAYLSVCVLNDSRFIFAPTYAVFALYLNTTFLFYGLYEPCSGR